MLTSKIVKENIGVENILSPMSLHFTRQNDTIIILGSCCRCSVRLHGGGDGNPTQNGGF